MAILIYDNGGSYSDHSIHFYNTIGFDLMDAENIAMADNPIGHIIGVAESINWFEGGAVPIGDIIQPDQFLNTEIVAIKSDYIHKYVYVLNMKLINTLGKPLIKKLFDYNKWKIEDTLPKYYAEKDKVMIIWKNLYEYV